MTRSALASQRQRVTVLLGLLFAITYLDRVCISVAGPRMQAELHIDPAAWGWVAGVFTIAYCVFEIPTGMMGDRIGPRRVLTRVVIWWSAFTALTGAVTGFYPLLATRFLFGAGEAGAFPNSSIAISRWFPPERRATLSGITLMASQLGGAAAPLLVVPIQMHYGWRASFYVFGVLGLVWSIAWYVGFRDAPAAGPVDRPGHTAYAFPWRSISRSSSLWALLGVAFCYVYVYNFFQTWFHTFLVKGRGVGEEGLWFSTLPYVLAAVANLTGGAASDALVRRLGLKRGRKIGGILCLTAAGGFTLAAMLCHGQVLTVVLLALVYGAITFQQSGAFGVMLDVGHRYAGAIVGLGNMCAQVGGLIGSVAYGYIVARTGSYDAPFIPMAVILFLGALCWTRVDASRELEPFRATVRPAISSR